MNILLINPPNCGRSIPDEKYGITSIKMNFRGEPLSLETLNLDYYTFSNAITPTYLDQERFYTRYAQLFKSCLAHVHSSGTRSEKEIAK